MTIDLRLQILNGMTGRYDHRWAGRDRICDDFSRLYMLSSGEARVEIGGTNITLIPGRIYLFPSGRWARYRCPEAMTLSWVHLRLEAPAGLDCFARWNPPLERPQAEGETKDMDKAMKGLSAGTPVGRLTAMSHLAAVLTPFLPETWEKILPPQEDLIRLEPIIARMEAALDRGITLEELAAIVHLHPTYLSNLFSRTFGIPPLQYHIHLRIRQARNLLLTTRLAISEVALRLGYEDPFYFSRLFKRHVGISPKRFRQLGGTSGMTVRELKQT